MESSPEIGHAAAYSRGEWRWRLSKSKLTTFQHCARRLWLQVHRRDLAAVDGWPKSLFKAGHRIGELARLQVPNGILINPDPQQLATAILQTEQLLAQGRPLFEAAFVREGVVVRADILEPQPGGAWKLLEVKNSGAVRPYQVQDVAIQAWVLTGSKVKISGVSVRLPRQVLRPGRHRSHIPGFIDFDVSRDAVPLMSEVPALAAAARRTLDGPEPDRPVGPHCTRPFRCEFRHHCAQQQASGGKK